MKISCLCSTYGRPTLISESVECFLRQDYPNKELIILNDDKDIHYVFDHPDVRIFNYKERFNALGEKRNACAKLATGDAFALWDDDDIYLPHRLTVTAKYLKQRDFFKPTTAYFMPKKHKIPLKVGNNMFHAQSSYTREFFIKVGKYKESLDKGEDIEFQRRATKLQIPLGTKVSVEEMYYIYRWGYSPSHLSVAGTTLKTKREKVTGVYKIEPQWNQDYLKLI